MRVAVVTEQRLYRTPAGEVWSPGPSSYLFWARYLAVFEQVRVVGRMQNVPEPPPGCVRADGPGVCFAPIPYYVGPLQYCRQFFALRRALAKAIPPDEAIVIRAPSQIGAVLIRNLIPVNRPYGLEVVGDPFDVFASGALSQPLHPLFRRVTTSQLRTHCAKAAAVAYVTAATLQRRYPAGAGAFTTNYSSVELRADAFLPAPRRVARVGKSHLLVTVASLAQLYKAPDVLIRAIAACVRSGLDLQLSFIGDGKYRPQVEALSRSEGVGDRCHFLGQMPAGDAIRAELDKADLFILPSRTEGLPRAVIEAMARGLPCVGSTAGGIPELLPPEDMVPPDDVGALAAKIREVVENPARMTAMSTQNLQKAQEYRDEVLRERRFRFYQEVQTATTAFLGSRLRM